MPLRLLPPPRELVRLRGRHALGRELVIEGAGPAATRARALLAAYPSAAAAESRLVFHDDAALPPEGFALAIEPHALHVTAASERGRLWAVETLAQIAAQHDGALPCLRLRDWPDLPERGYMLDVSRDRVPTMARLEALVDRLASLRVNQLQLYVEHAFAFAGHETVWREASPLTPAEVRALAARCEARGIELVPNLNCFGHMERWLAHPAYRHLAELPGGRADGRPSSCLAPTPESLAFVESRWEEFLAAFTSRRVNVGCDETVELGQGRSRADCDRDGPGLVWGRFVAGVVAGLHRRGYEAQIWADMPAHHPAALDVLPREGLTALAWTYEAPRAGPDLPEAARPFYRGFAPQAERLAACGMPFLVCPGTSTWNSLVGRWGNLRGNVLDAAAAARAFGARGMLLTDWGDNGHLQPPAVSLAPLVLGALAAWSADAAATIDLEAALDVLVYGTPDTAARALAAASAHERLGMTALNGTPFAYALLRAEDDFLPAWGDLSAGEMECAMADLDAAVALGTASATAHELSHAARLARLGAARLARERLGHGAAPRALLAQLDDLVAEQRRLWLASSRPGGLADSLARLARARRELAREPAA